MVLPVLVGLICIIAGIVVYADGTTRQDALYMVAAGIVALVIGVAGWWGLRASDRRNRSIRRVLGPHQFGSSDPAIWTNDLLASVKDPREIHGTVT